MSSSLPTLLLRHRKENRKKCSLTHLENFSDFIFYTYPKEKLPPLDNYLLLSISAEEELQKEDSGCSILLIDGSWLYADKMERNLPKTLVKKKLPSHIQTAYPRKQTLCPFPQEGLASIEALYAAFFILGKEREKLLNHYYWKEKFLKKNEAFFSRPIHL